MGRLFFKLRRTTLFLFVMVMPMGVRVDPEHPNEFSMSVHGGTGQLVSVLRDCDGNVTSSEESKFEEVAGSMQVSHQLGSGQILTLGIRSGKLESQGRFPTSSYSYESGSMEYGSYERTINYRYFNPYIALEGRKVGIGIGHLGGDYSTKFGDYDDNLPVSAHFRLGNYQRSNFQISLNEDLPLASGTGLFKMGIGYPAGARMQMFTGLSAGFYEDLGLVQQVYAPLSDRFDLDFSTRLGSTDGKFQGGVALGLRYHVPFGGE